MIPGLESPYAWAAIGKEEMMNIRNRLPILSAALFISANALARKII
jgi:hypothetical protein